MRRTLLLSILTVLSACPPADITGTGGGSAAAGGGTASQGGGTAAMGGGSATGGGGMMAGPILPRPSRSTAIDLTTDDALLLAVNPDNDTLSIFTASNNTKVGTVSFPAGSMPVSVVIHPNNTEAYVVLRKAQKLVKVTGINTLNPAVDSAQAALGSEPTGVALSPSGAIAVVANFGDDDVTFVSTPNMSTGTIRVGPNPRAVAITNNGDMNDADEKAYVTLFYGTPTAETVDTGRTGKVVVIPLSTMVPSKTVPLAPIADTGFEIDGGTTTGVSCSPNQLYGIAIDSGKAYVTHVCAAPHGPVQPLTNVFAAVSVIDIASDTEDTSATGSQALSKLLGTNGTLLGVPIAIEFKAPGIAYLVSEAADAVQRIAIDTGGNRWCLGNCTAFAQIDLGSNGSAGGTAVKGSIGLVTAHGSATTKLYTNNWIDRSVSVVELSGTQQVATTLRSENLPVQGNADFPAWSGKKLYFTGTGRWSARGVNSCGSCHPDGLSDNLTWVFAAGPRQTVPMDGTYAKTTGGAPEQRALNWTAIFDELHDFEGNTRGTAGGVGALVSDTALSNASRLDLTLAQSVDGGSTLTRHDNLSGSARQLMVFKSALQSWDQIDAFAQTIHANRAPTNLDPNDVSAGRTVFQNGKCQNCHGGAKWTTSRVSYTPAPDKNGTAAAFTDAGTAVAPSGLRTQALSGTLNFAFAVNRDTNKIAAEQRLDGGAPVGPERITCVLRDVRTFDFTDPVEKKADGTVAQGANGFNPPSLLGLATSAPYMHNGSAADLDTVLSASKFNAHLTAANQNFTLSAAEQKQLKAFLLSIDETTAPIAPDATGTDICAGY